MIKEQIQRGMYRKPVTICRFSPEWESIIDPEEVAEFIAFSKREIEEKINKLGFRLRLAAWEDIDGIDQLHRRCFPPDNVTLESPYDLIRIISFGYTAVLEGPDGRIMGCNICTGYDDPERTAYGVRITVDPSVAGHNLGALAVSYTCLIGMERGSWLRRRLLGPVNYGSASNFLNHVAYLCESFCPDLPGFGPRFTVCLPLTPGGVMNNKIDLDKVRDFIKTHKPGQDYLLVACRDLEGITQMYEKTPLKNLAEPFVSDPRKAGVFHVRIKDFIKCLVSFLIE